MRKEMDYGNVAVWGIVLLVISALTTKKVVAVIGNKAQFKRALKPIADQIKRSLGIDQEILIAQSALESGWGQSGLTKTANNLFGMTAGPDFLKVYSGKLAEDKLPRWTSLETGHAVVWLPTTEYSPAPPDKIRYWEIPGDVLEKAPDGKGGSKLKVKRAFRAYKDWGESVADWAKKISTNSRYAAAFEYAKKADVRRFAEALKQGGYATDPAYADKVVKVAQAVREIPEATV